jgi:SAM-dependent methyltransferase
LPRPLLDSRRQPGAGYRRYLDVARRWLARFLYRGAEVSCPCCGREFGAFAPDWNRPGAICPGCGAHERHRSLCLYLEERTEIGKRPLSLLHFAPEYALSERLRNAPGLEYVTADLVPDTADLELDITRMALTDRSFDAIICSHVLEHVEDDRSAMRELYRVLRPGGWALVLVPLDPDREATYEDPAIATPDQRREAYWQEDHVRLYSLDIADRLRDAGFDVTTEYFADGLPPSAADRFGLIRPDVIFRCERPVEGRGPLATEPE